jgi:hypothetical protein
MPNVFGPQLVGSVVITLQYAPINGLILTPVGTGITFSPSVLYFAPGESSKPLNYDATQFSPATVQDYIIEYRVSGPDAANYLFDSSTIKFDFVNLEYHGVWIKIPDLIFYEVESPPFVLHLTANSTSDLFIELISSSDVVFNPNPVYFPSGTTEAEFTVTVTPTLGSGSYLIHAEISGDNAYQYFFTQSAFRISNQCMYPLFFFHYNIMMTELVLMFFRRWNWRRCQQLPTWHHPNDVILF